MHAAANNSFRPNIPGETKNCTRREKRKRKDARIAEDTLLRLIYDCKGFFLSPYNLERVVNQNERKLMD